MRITDPFRLLWRGTVPSRCASRRAILLVTLGVLFTAADSATQVPTSRPATRCLEISDDGAITLRGRAVFIDREGRTHTRPKGKGSLYLRPQRAPDGNFAEIMNREFEIVDGAWVATFRSRGRQAAVEPLEISLHGCEVDGEPVAADYTWSDVAAHAELVFELRAFTNRKYRVVDATTNIPLRAIEVFHDRGMSSLGRVHPVRMASLVQIVAAGTSPISLPVSEYAAAGPGRMTLWLRAPGYAWRSLDVSTTEGPDLEIGLLRSAALTVRVIGTLPRAQDEFCLRLYREDGKGHALAESDLADGLEIRFEDVAPGRYRARLEMCGLPERDMDFPFLSEAMVAVEPGGSAQIELTAAGVAVPWKVRLRGSIRFPAGWQVDRQRLELELEADEEAKWRRKPRQVQVEAIDPDGQEWRFDCPEILTGEYVLRVHPSQYQLPVSVRRLPTEEVQIEVPKPARVVCRLIDAETRLRCNHVNLSWHPFPTGLFATPRVETVVCAPDASEVCFPALPGRIRVFASGEDFVVEAKSLDIRPGVNEFELEVKPLYGLRIELRDGTERIPCSPETGWQAWLELPGGNAMVGPWRGQDVLVVLKPGEYILGLLPGGGYAPVAYRRVTIGRGAFPTVVVQVQKTK